MIEIISGHKLTNADRIREMSDEELANDSVIGFMYMCGYRTNTSWRSAHTERDYDTKDDAIEAELQWLRQPAE